MSSLAIRRAGPEHAADIRRLLAVQLGGHGIAITDDGLASAIDGVLEVPKRGFFLVALRDGACIGVAYVSFIWALEHGGHAGWLEELYVMPEHRGGGVGTRLLEAVIAAAEGAGCAALDLEIDSAHERVRSLYERHGFTALPRSRVVKKLGLA
ncbi:MAG: GNAT family N-acetyltransferase [Chromatiales bacterium]|nr:GNAT family N-acetyltransferase [Chromatiales bacterium]